MLVYMYIYDYVCMRVYIHACEINTIREKKSLDSLVPLEKQSLTRKVVRGEEEFGENVSPEKLIRHFGWEKIQRTGNGCGNDMGKLEAQRIMSCGAVDT